MTILVVDSSQAALRKAADDITSQNAVVSVVLKSSVDAAAQFAMYHPVDLVFARTGMLCEQLFEKIKYYQPMTECYVIDAGQNLSPFLRPYVVGADYD